MTSDIEVDSNKKLILNPPYASKPAWKRKASRSGSFSAAKPPCGGFRNKG